MSVNRLRPGSIVVAGALFLGGAAPLYAAPEVAAAAQSVAARATPRGAAAIDTWILHYDASLDAITQASHGDLLRGLGTRTKVLVVVPDEAHEAWFLDALSPEPALARRISFARVPGGLSIWARDRYLLLERHGVRTVVLPDPTGVRVERRGDVEFARRILGARARARILPTRLHFEGGDVICGDRIALVGAGTVAQNRRRWQGEDDRVIAEFEDVLARRVIVVGEHAAALPHDHIDMFMHLLDDETAVVGDPRLVLDLWPAIEASGLDRHQFALLGWPRQEHQSEWIARYDAVAAQLREEGMKVLRVPSLHGPQDDVLFSWTNVVTEQRGAKRHAYVPAYGLPLLDAAARRAWAAAGCTVHAVAARTAAYEGGAVRCLTNVVRRRSGGTDPAAATSGESTRVRIR